jgi:hypothetical protein
MSVVLKLLFNDAQEHAVLFWRLRNGIFVDIGLKYVRCHFELFPGRGSCENPPEIQVWVCFRTQVNSVSHARFPNRFLQYITCQCAPLLTCWLVRKAQAAFQFTMQAVDTDGDRHKTKLRTVELHLSGLIWTASHPDM